MGRSRLWTWALAIALSTLLTHPHHVVAVVAGCGVGAAANGLIRRRAALAPIEEGGATDAEPA